MQSKLLPLLLHYFSSSISQTNIALNHWIQLAKDLQYSGNSNDPVILKDYVYKNLTKRLRNKTAHVRKSPFEPNVKKSYTTKKVVRKVIPKVLAKVL